MAENVQITPGSGVAIGADSVTDVTLGSAQIQYVKIMDGSIGGTNKAGVTSNGLAVDGSGVTQPISGTVTTIPPSNASTNITEVGGTSIALGQDVSASSFPVVIAVDQSVIPVSGTVAVTQSTSPWVVSGTVTSNIGTTGGLALDTTVSGLQVPQGSTTSGQRGILELGAVSTAAPSYATGQTSPLSLTLVGALRVDGSAVTQPVSGSVSVSNFPATQNVNVINASIPVTQSGSWTVSLTSESIEIGTVDQGTPNTLANAWPVELSDGTNLLGTSAHPVRIDPTGTTTQPVSLASTTITGTVAVTQSTSPWVINGTVTANAGTNLNTSALALDTSVNGILVSQGSTTSGEKGPLIQGAVTTSSPSYTTAQTSPLSLTLSGALRVDASATTQPISGTVTANAGTGNFMVVQSTGTNLHTVVDSGSITVANSTLAVTQSTSPWVDNITQWNSVALGSPSAYGTSPGAVTVIGVNAFITNTPTVTANAGTGTFQTNVTNASIAVTQSGIWTVQPGNTANTTPWLTTINQGGNSAIVTAANALKVDGSAVTQPISAVSLPLPTGATTSANQTNGSQKTQIVDSSGNVVTSTTINSSQALDVHLPDRSAVISLTAVAQTAQVSMEGKGSVAFVITSVGTGGQVICEGSLDGVTWQGLDVWQESQESWVDNGAVITTADQFWVEPIGALWFVRLRCTAITSGTITGSFWVSSAVMGTYEFQGSSGTNLPNNIILVGGKTNDGTPQFQPIPLSSGGTGVITTSVDDMFATQNITTQDLVTTSTTGANGQIIYTGTPTANSTAAFTLTSDQAMTIEVSGTWTGTLQVEISMDNGTTWFQRTLHQTGTNFSSASFTGNFTGAANIAGYTNLRVRAIAAMTGTAVIRVNSTTNINILYVDSGVKITDNSGNIATMTVKGTQATPLLGVQQAKDSGRSYVTLTADAIAGVTSETLVTFTTNKQGTATGSQTNYTPTSGKTLRIQSITVTVQSGAASGEWVRVKLRHNTAGATTTSSSLVYTIGMANNSNQLNTGGSATAPIPDGLEIFGDGTQTIGISHISSATTNVESITLCGYEY